MRTFGTFLRRLRPRSTRVRVALAVVVVIAGVAIGGVIYKKDRTGSIYHPHQPFTPQAPAKLPATGQDRFSWPLYGYSPDHTRFYPASERVRPPYRLVWAHDFGTLLEFPPVLRGDHIFQLGDNATLYATNKRTGATFWSRKLGSLSASSPAVIGRTVYATVLEGPSGGRIYALNYGNGKTRWYRDLSAASESSPLVYGGRVYVGTQSGEVYALNARDGSVIWTYHAAGAVKASPTYKDGVLYFGDYGGQVQAVRASDGHRVWASGSEGALFGSGTFYSTPAVIYGRVFLGNTDGRIYAYDASSGHLDWAVQTGNYVYASPAVTDAPGLGPTIYLGSYDGTFYALNAQSGHIDWTYNAGGRISGSATIIGRTVYFADLGDRKVFGLGISTGHVDFQWFSGSFDPVISDGEHIYLTGYNGLYDLAPR